MTTSFTLSEAGEGTSMAWEADVKIAGPVRMGQRVLQPIVNQQVGQVLGALEQRVGGANASTGEAEAPANSPQGLNPLAGRVANDREQDGRGRSFGPATAFTALPTPSIAPVPADGARRTKLTQPGYGRDRVADSVDRARA